ncbi:MAG: glycine dehydrogenase subunit 2 [Planctomycetota bacterium]|nr:MAG: glycine dehydrogenase subunit 2 [Planctomycetota bacterium]
MTPQPDTPPAPADTPALRTLGERAPEPLIFEKTSPGARCVTLPAPDVEPTPIPADLAGPAPDWPEVGMLEAVRHYTHLSKRNFSIDGEFYPLGSCTMKFNPRINEHAASLPGFTSLHPMQDDADLQGALRLLYETRRYLEAIAGLDEASLQPAAGAHGEYTALKVIRAYYKDRGEPQRTKVLAPENAHGTNPASCAMCGAGVLAVKAPGGYTDVDDLKRLIDAEGPESIMALMITNPNTAGLFDGKIDEIAGIVHDAGAMLYLDGANMNAILGRTRPGDFGADAMHYNTHKTFSTPHGCGGPGAGPIVVREALAPYLPVPQVVERDGVYALDFDRPKSIGKVRSFVGQFGVLVRCWAYLRACGAEGLREVADQAVLSANYLAARLRHRYETPYFDPGARRFCAHEFVTVPARLLSSGVTLLDIAKRMIDYGVHPPTMHWPVRNCLMIEPTETEPLEVLDRFVAVMERIADEIEADPASLARAPADAPVRRLDIVGADRKPRVVHGD